MDSQRKFNVGDRVVEVNSDGTRFSKSVWTIRKIVGDKVYLEGFEDKWNWHISYFKKVSKLEQVLT